MSSKFGPTIWDLGKAEGEAKGMQRALFIQGRKRFGEPNEATRPALDAMTNVEQLERLLDRVLEVTTWQELLQTS